MQPCPLLRLPCHRAGKVCSLPCMVQCAFSQYLVSVVIPREIKVGYFAEMIVAVPLLTHAGTLGK